MLLPFRLSILIYEIVVISIPFGFVAILFILREFEHQ